MLFYVCYFIYIKIIVQRVWESSQPNKGEFDLESWNLLDIPQLKHLVYCVRIFMFPNRILTAISTFKENWIVICI